MQKLDKLGFLLLTLALFSGYLAAVSFIHFLFGLSLPLDMVDNTTVLVLVTLTIVGTIFYGQRKKGVPSDLAPCL